MRIVSQQMILMKYHALFVILEKNNKLWQCRLLQIIDGALRVNGITVYSHTFWKFLFFFFLYFELIVNGLA